MALNILLSISPWVILLIISIITLSIIIFLTLTERILKRKVNLKQQKEDNSPTRRIKLLISSHEEPENKLRRVNAIAREIFKEAYNIDSKISYYELADKFQKQGKKNASKFCQEMFKILYSGETLQSKKVYELAKILEKINQETQEEKSFKKLEKNMRVSLKLSKQKSNLLKRFSKVEDKFIDKFAKEKREPQEEQTTTSQTTSPQPKPLPITNQVPTEFKTKRQRLQNLPLAKLFKFRKTPGITLTSEIEPDKSKKQLSLTWSSIKLKTPLLSKKKQEKKIIEKSTYQKIDDLQREVIEKQKQIERMRTQKQIQELQRTAVEVEINKKEQWPPVTFTPKHLNETRKMSPEMEHSFEKANKEIELLEGEIKNKQKAIKKLQSSPIKRTIKPPIEDSNTIIKKFFGKSDKDLEKEIQKKKKQIEIINLKKEQHNYSDYNAPKVVTPKKQTIEFTPENKPIEKEDFIHDVDSMDRIKEQIRTRRMGI